MRVQTRGFASCDVCVDILGKKTNSVGLHARVILDGVTCQTKELGDVRHVLSVLGVL